MDKKNRIKIGELEKLSGMPRSTIHYYIREGILHPPHKTSRTMAYYDESHLNRLQAIHKMKSDYQKMKNGLRVPRALLEQRGHESNSHDRNGDNRAWEKDPVSTGSQIRKQEIIEAAIQLFSQKGYHHTNVRDITQALGISKGTFYLYYSSKRDLFIEVVDDVIRNIIGEVAGAIRQESNLIKRTILRGKVFHANYTKYNEILNQLRAEMASEDPWAQKKVKKVYRALTEPLIREAREAIKRGAIRQVDPDLLAYTLIGITEIMALRSTLDNKYDFDQILTFMFDLLKNGLNFDFNGL